MGDLCSDEASNFAPDTPPSLESVSARGRAPRRAVRRFRQQYTAMASSSAMSVAPTAIAATRPTLRPSGPFPGMLGPVGPDSEVVKGGANSGVVFDPFLDVASGRTEADDDEVSAVDCSSEAKEFDVGSDKERIEDSVCLVVWPWVKETFRVDLSVA